jgi:CRP-like cAMP-binding protein
MPNTQPLKEFIRSSLWTPALTPEQLERVEATVVERQVRAGGFVGRRGDQVDSWTGVIDGVVALSIVSPEGKEMIFTGVATGGWFGEGTLLKKELRKYDAVALRDCRIASMPRQTFEWLLERSIGFNRFILRQLNERLSQFIGIIESDRSRHPDARVAHCLANLFHPFLYPGTTRRLLLSQEEVGSLAGLCRQRANQALQALEKAGALTVEYGRIIVRDLEVLRGLSA